jgi:zinc D-Ala-D-Ala dipeptidase
MQGSAFVMAFVAVALGCTPATPAESGGSGASGGSAGAAAGAGGGPTSPIDPSSTELVTVTSAAWDSVPATLQRHARSTGAAWTPVGGSIPVVLGKSGLGWGRGLNPTTSDGGPDKHEGDGRSPAGIFALGTAFGYAAPDQATWISIPYLQATDDLECVDDPNSSHYNQLVYKSTIANVDWSSSEQMKRPDSAYLWGVFVDHNTSPTVAGDGSCIFLHLWSGPSSATVGCTAGDETQMKELIAWLDPSAHPVLVQLPEAVYDAHRSDWALP